MGLTDDNRLTVYIVALLVFAGFGFKTAAVPFHFWCPDVYQGARRPSRPSCPSPRRRRALR